VSRGASRSRLSRVTSRRTSEDLRFVGVLTLAIASLVGLAFLCWVRVASEGTRHGRPPRPMTDRRADLERPGDETARAYRAEPGLGTEPPVGNATGDCRGETSSRTATIARATPDAMNIAANGNGPAPAPTASTADPVSCAPTQVSDVAAT
jgi:hypothetical protein